MIGIQINGGGGNVIDGETIDSSNGKQITIDHLGNKTIKHKDGTITHESKSGFKKPSLPAKTWDMLKGLGVDVSKFDRVD